MNIVQAAAKSDPPTAGALRRDRRREERHHRSAGAGALSGRDARPLSRPHAGGAAAGLGRGGGGDPQARQRDLDADRAAGRQYRPGRRPDPASTARSCCRSTASTASARSIPSPTPSPARPASRLQRAREAAAAVDRLYPQLLPSEGTCTIGGNLSTNAGGTAALAYGIARSHALGLEVVLADGRVLQQSQQAEEGQHRLRSARTCSSAPKARSASSPRRCCGWCRARARSRPPSSACPRRRRRSICSASPPSAPPAA